MPFSRSLVSPIATMADENIMVCAMIPGSRNSRYVVPGTLIEPPKTYANSSTNITGWIVTSSSISGIRRMCSRLRQTTVSDCCSRRRCRSGAGGSALTSRRSSDGLLLGAGLGRPGVRRSASARWPVRCRNTSSRLGRFRPRSSTVDPAVGEDPGDPGHVGQAGGRRGEPPARLLDVHLGRVLRAAARQRAADRSRSDSVTTTLARPASSLSCVGVPAAITLPLSITTISSASWSASSRYCVVSSSVVPSRTSPRSTSHRSPGCGGRARWSARPGTAPAARRPG